MTTRTNAIAAAIAAFAMLFATPAVAVDGEILIDQAKVNVGGITPGDTPGFPATLSRPGRYKLVGNLKVPSDNSGIVVTADGVTIDLNGFTIGSNPPGQALSGVSARLGRGLRVIGGTIGGFQAYGIEGGEHGVVEDMRVVSNHVGVFMTEGSRIRNSTIADGGSDGIECLNYCLIEQNVVTGNAEGIGANNGMVLGNVIASNEGVGLYNGAGTRKTGYGNNVLFGNNGGGSQILGQVYQLHPNVCDPPCP